MCVLFVDDESLLREIVAEYLTECGFTVLTACDAREAFELIDKPPQRFTVLLSDFNMPGTHNGCDVASRMKSTHPHVHIFIVTGRPDLIDTACGDDLEYSLIQKPFNLRHVAEQLATLS